MSALTRVYEEMAIERLHICTGCGAKNRLTHSHIVPRSQEKSLEAVKENICYHCVECHNRYEHSMERVFMKDFQANMIYMFNNAQSFYWLRMFKMQQHWKTQFTFELSGITTKQAISALEILKEVEGRTHRIHMGITTEKIEG